MMNKRGFLSSFLAFFGATILIVLILIVYIIGGGVIKKLDKSVADVAVYNELKVGIDDIFSYSERFVNLTEVRFLVAKGGDLDGALAEVGYER